MHALIGVKIFIHYHLTLSEAWARNFKSAIIAKVATSHPISFTAAKRTCVVGVDDGGGAAVASLLPYSDCFLLRRCGTEEYCNDGFVICDGYKKEFLPDLSYLIARCYCSSSRLRMELNEVC